MKVKEYITVTVNGVKKVDEPLVIDEDGNYKQYQDIIREYKDKGYEHVTSIRGGYNDYYVMNNEKEGKVVNIRHHIHFKTTDRNGKRIYFGSILRFVPNKSTAADFQEKIYGFGKPEDEYNRWSVEHDPDTNGIYLSGPTSTTRFFGYNYSRYTVKSLDIFKNFEIIKQ